GRGAMCHWNGSCPSGPQQHTRNGAMMGRGRTWDSVEKRVVGEYDVFSVSRHVMRSPRTGDLHAFHVVEVPTCVQVIPFTADGRVVLVEQFRQGVQRMSLEFPAGVVEDGE